MKNDKIRSIFKCMTFFSYLFFIVFVLTAPRLDKAQPDPYFQLKIMPIVYWLGVITSITSLLISIFFEGVPHSSSFGISVLMLLMAYTNCIPRTMYKNPIYTDAMAFNYQVFYVLKESHVAPGSEGEAVPGITLFSSMLSLIMGIDDILVSKIIQYSIPFITLLFLYLTAQLFTGKKGALLCGLIFIGFNWLGFVFNKQSFSLVLQSLTSYCLAKSFLATPRRSMYATTLLCFVALVVSHPASSFMTMINIFAPFILSSSLLSVLKLNETYLRTLGLRDANRKPFLSTTLIFSLIWIDWNIHQGYPYLYDALTTTINILSEFYGSPVIASEVQGIASGYTPAYRSITTTRLYGMSILSVTIGLALAFFYMFNKKFDLKSIFLSSWFLSTLPLYLYVLYASRWLEKPYLYALFPFSILLSWFIMDFYPRRPFTKIVTKLTKSLLVSYCLLLVLLLPVTMYAHISFVYPSTPSLRLMDYITKHVHGTISIFGGHIDVDYFVSVNEPSELYIKRIYTRTEKFDVYWNLSSYDGVAVTFRAYAKDAFVETLTPSTIFIPSLEEKMLMKPELGFARIYVIDSWDILYLKQ